jgi:hypothetical protein
MAMAQHAEATPNLHWDWPEEETIALPFERKDVRGLPEVVRTTKPSLHGPLRASRTQPLGCRVAYGKSQPASAKKSSRG